MPELSALLQAHEALLIRAVDTARRAWPALRVDPTRFLGYLAERLQGEDITSELAQLHLADLYLACAAAAGDTAALSVFEATLMAEVGAAAARVDASPWFVDEVKQVVRERLFVGVGDAPRKILQYAGRGPLAGWIRVTALRTARNLRPDDRRRDDRGVSRLAATERDPALELLRERLRGPFERAFAAALAALPQSDRNLLRLSYLDGLTARQIARIENVHETTAARRIARLRDRILADVRRDLAAELSLSEAELDSAIRAIRSELHLSIARLLA